MKVSLSFIEDIIWKAPNSRSQAPEKLQAPRANPGAWFLDILWSLDVEVWSFSSVPSVCSCSKRLFKHPKSPTPSQAWPRLQPISPKPGQGHLRFFPSLPKVVPNLFQAWPNLSKAGQGHFRKKRLFIFSSGRCLSLTTRANLCQPMPASPAPTPDSSSTQIKAGRGQSRQVKRFGPPGGK